MLSERTIINALILAAGLIVGPYLTIATFQGNYWPILIAGGTTFLLVIFFFVGNRICALPLLGIAFGGRLNFLPAGLSAGDLCALVTILYYLVTYVALKQRGFKTGPRAFLFPMVIISMIILYHLHSFGLHVFGAAQEGSRPAVIMLAYATAYFCGINIVNPSVDFLRRLPWYCWVAGLLSSLPFIITTYAPQSAPTLVYLTNDVNTSAYFGEEIVRQGNQASLGASLQLVLLAYFPIYTWWRPERWWVACLSLGCFFLVCLGGFRSGMASYFLAFLLGTWCYCSWRTLFLVPLCAIAILGLSLLQSSNLVSMPLVIQRSLSFLPGAWDEDVKASAESSNDFRNSIQQVYMQEYFAKSPILGNGFTFDPGELDSLAPKIGDSDGYYLAKSFILTKSFHIGWISVYDAVGCVGSAAFILLAVNIAYFSGRFIYGHDRERRSPLLPLRIWIFCSVTTSMIGYFTVFGSFPAAFPGLCAYALILVHIREIERKPEMQVARTPEHALFGLPEMGRHLPVGPLNETNR